MPEWPVISLFTGAGGLDLGLELAGFYVALAVEIDRVRCETIRLNRPLWRLLQEDIRLLDTESILSEAGLLPGEPALVSGGPPCQPFSKSAIRRGRNPLTDFRVPLVMEFARVVREAKPQAFILENVPGLAGKPGRELFIKFIEELSSNGYKLNWKTLNAVDFGVPQKRRRLFVIGIRKDLEIEPSFPSPTHAPPEKARINSNQHNLRPYVTAGEAIGDLDDGLVAEDEIPNGKWGHLLAQIPPGKNYIWLTERYSKKPIFKYRSRYWSFLLKLHPKMPSWTIQANPGQYVGPFHWRNRRLRISEVKRLQTFPDDWEVAGSKRQQWAQLGDAVPPLLARKIGEKLISLLSHSR